MFPVTPDPDSGHTSELHNIINALVAEAIAAERQRLCKALRKAAERFTLKTGPCSGVIDPPGVALLALADELERS